MALSNEYRPLKTLALYVTAGLAITAFANLLSMIGGFGQMIGPGLSVDLADEAISIWLMMQGLIYIASLPVGIFTIVIFLVWLHRAHSNLEPLQARNLQFTPGWAVGWWFIPFANLVKPFQVVREVWVESDPDTGDDDRVFLSGSLHSAPTYMGIWWAMWLLANISSNILGRVYDPDTMSDVGIAGLIFIIPGALSLTAGLLAIKVVRDITERQAERAANQVNRQRFNQSPPPPPIFDKDL